MTVDAAQVDALAPNLIDEEGEHQKDRRAGEPVPDACGEADRAPGDVVRPDPRSRREERDDDGGGAPEPPAREADGDEIEDRESEFRTRRYVDKPDDRDAGGSQQRAGESQSAAPHIDVGRGAQCGLRLASP